MISSVSSIEIKESDTICIDSFDNIYFSGEFAKLDQKYNEVGKDRRFIIGKTTWEFDNYNLYCDFSVIDGFNSPTHDPYYVSYSSNYLYNDYSTLEIHNYDSGSVTHYTMETNGSVGTAPPNKLTLLSPNIITNLYYSERSYDKAVTIKILLKFMR